MSKLPGKSLPTPGSRVLPTSVSQVGTITKYELLNYFRSRRFFILLAIGLIISGLLTALVAYYGVSNVAPCLPSTCSSPPLAFYSFWWGSSITFVIVLSGIFFGGDAISGEFQNKTGYFLVANPLRRSSIHWEVARRFDSVSDGVSYLCCYNGRKRSLLFRGECPLPVRRIIELLNIVSYRRTRIHFLLQFTLQEQLNVDPRDRHPLSLCLQPNPTHPVRSRADRTVVHHYVWFRDNWKRADGYLPHYTAY